MEHLTNTVLQEFTDGLLDASRKALIQNHINICRECSAKLLAFKQLDLTIRKLPLERVSAGFTGRVMRAIGLAETSLLRQLVLNFLPLAGALLILILLLGIVAGSPQQHSPISDEAGKYVQSFEQKIGSALSSGTNVLLHWIHSVAGLFVTIPSLKFIVVLSLAFGVIALFDEFIFVPLMKKRG